MTPAEAESAERPERRRRARVRPRELEFHLLVLVTLGLVAFGLVMVYSASSARSALAAGDPAYYLKRQALYASVGLAALAILARLDFRLLRRAGGPLLLVTLVFLGAVLVLGTPVNGARRWLSLGILDFQPSELAKLALALWLAALLARRRPPRSLAGLARPIGVVLLVACALILAEPDLGTATAIAIMAAAILVVAGTPIRVLGAAGGLAVTIVLAAAWLEPYRRARIFSFLDPWSDPDGAGFQSVQAMIALGSGGIFGVGLGESVQKIHYLPEASTDMIFAIVGEELGLIGAVAVIAAFAAFGYAGFSVALRCRDRFGKLLAAGLTALVCGQAAVNLAAVLGLAPLTGIPLPFVSYGGSSLIVALSAVGILLNIAVDDGGKARARVPDRGRRHGGPRPAGARARAGAEGARRERDVRRLA
ncbi:MAG: putative lipid II flippase FtsW [Actinomycetota bacterium]|nr:putative lipid II flippase FtsW [Actinomycetota bacterium]